MIKRVITPWLLLSGTFYHRGMLLSSGCKCCIISGPCFNSGARRGNYYGEIQRDNQPEEDNDSGDNKCPGSLHPITARRKSIGGINGFGPLFSDPEIINIRDQTDRWLTHSLITRTP